MQKFDALIIGSGQGGVPLAVALAKKGQRVALFERSFPGGTCVNYGCIPSKAFLEAAHTAAIGRYAQEMGVRVETFVDFHKLMTHIGRISEESSEGIEQRLDDANVTFVAAEASFHGQNKVTANGSVYDAPLIVINTGKSPLIPNIPGLSETPYFTYQNFWTLNVLPPRTLILGGGYVGVELAQGLARLGSEVHVIERSERIISDEEEDVSQILMSSLEQDGVQFHLQTEVAKVVRRGNHIVLITAAEDEIQGDVLIIATGRKANTESLAVDKAGIVLDEKGHIKVDADFQTTNPRVYAIGDVTGQPAFTHVAWEDHRRLLSILNGDTAKRSQGDRILGYGFFTQPQVGRVGLTAAQAEAKRYKARVVTLPLKSVTRASLANRTEGFYRMVIDETNDQILGATLVGPEAAELAHVFIAHMEAGSTWLVLERSVHIHPTFGEGLPSLVRLLKS